MSYYKGIMKKGGVVLSKGRICNACKQEIQREMLDRNLSICPQCGCYLRMHARKRILSLADKKSFREWDANMKWSNPLNDDVYAQKLIDASVKHKLNDAIITGEMNIDEMHVAIGVMDTRYMMASMGHVVGEKVTRLFEKAIKKKLPVILFCCSGGARMQEGIISLMQMEKTVAAVKRHSEAGLLYVSVLTNPTMGGVTASFAMLADVVIAEKGARIGFAGARVIEQNIGEKLPENFQTADFQLAHGFVDEIISRAGTREYLSRILKLHNNKSWYINHHKSFNLNSTIERTTIEQNAWKTVLKARSRKRPTSLDYINGIFDDFIELHGDKTFSDDHAIVGGIASIYGRTVMVIGQQKGKSSLDEAMYRKWGMPSPSGYRKALRLIKQAAKFKQPIICFVDTIGAACGIEAEEQGQGYAIASILKETSAIEVPILSIIHGEGGSGGALALGVANEVWMLENAVYSVLTPEGYASILWKDNTRAYEAAELMKMTSGDLKQMKIIDKVFREPEELCEKNMIRLCLQLKDEIILFLKKYQKKTNRYILNERYERFRKF